MSKDLGLLELRNANIDRDGEVFREIDQWSPADWAVALAGEVGEALNLLKKRRRDTGPRVSVREIGYELADALVYMDLLAQSLGIDLPTVCREKFNIVSEREGSKVRL